MLDNNLTEAFMHIYFDAFQASLEILHVSFNFALGGKLIASKIGVVRAITVVVVERMSQILVDLLSIWVEDVVFVGKHESSESVHADGCRVLVCGFFAGGVK